MDIDIRGIDKVQLVKKLYENSSPRGMGFLQYRDGGLSDEEALELSKASHLDYVRGRVMKLSVAGDYMRADLYDRDNGPGAAQRCVDAVLDEMTAPG